MNSIPAEFKEGAFLHKLVHTYPDFETHPIAIYSKSDSASSRGFEVVRFQLRKAESVTVQGKVYNYQARLVYPSNELWGTHGFSCVSIQAAHKRLQSMILEALKEKTYVRWCSLPR